MAMTVNLDAMISREDFESENLDGAEEAKRGGNELYLTQLTEEGRLASMRKPEFQRETSGWRPEIVSGFIKSVVDGDVIPAVIMWRSPRTGKLFVIDGAHRLSALIAWISDDYGDRTESRKFFQHQIDEAQETAAQKTRDLIEKEVGAFAPLRAYAMQNKSNPAADELKMKRSMRIMNDPIFIQWVSGDAQAAEASFVRINSTAVAIDQTEAELIETRKKPSGIASRAIVRAGTGYQYWQKFGEPTRKEIIEKAKLIYDQLIGPIVNYPVLALDLPASDRKVSANGAKTILDLVTFLNPIMPIKKGKPSVADDLDGSQTIAYLDRVKKSTERVFGRVHSGSLALHPGIYCYGTNGKFISKAFVGAIGFVNSLEANNRFHIFTKHRAKFEEFLIKHRHFVHQIGKGQGSGGNRGVPAIIRLYEYVFTKMVQRQGEQAIIDGLKDHESLSFLHFAPEIVSRRRNKLTKEDSAVVMLRESLANEALCKECGARLYLRDRSRDHKIRVADGGASTPENIQLTHPYCNSGYKEGKLARAKADMAAQNDR
jgi:hypothetical protein